MHPFPKLGEYFWYDARQSKSTTTGPSFAISKTLFSRQLMPSFCAYSFPYPCITPNKQEPLLAPQPRAIAWPPPPSPSLDHSHPTQPSRVCWALPLPAHLLQPSSSSTKVQPCCPMYSCISNHCLILNNRCRYRVPHLPLGTIIQECCRAWYLPREII